MLHVKDKKDKASIRYRAGAKVRQNKQARL